MQFFVDQKYSVNLHLLMHESIPKKKCDLNKNVAATRFIYFTIIFWWVSIDLFYYAAVT